MKKLSYLSAIFLMALSMLFVSCSKDDNEEDNNNNPGPVSKIGMTAKVNGEDWESDNFGCVITDGVPIIAGDCDGEFNIALTIGSFTEGTYSLTASYENFAVITDGVTSYTTLGEMQSTGSIKISSIDTDKKLISGTFEFVAIDLASGNTIEVTEGQFTDMTYVEENSPAGGNELQVDINGETFIADNVYPMVLMGEIIIASSNQDLSKMIDLTIPTSITEGSHDFGSASIFAQYVLNTDITMSATSGTLTITEHNTADKSIKGTFSFEAVAQTGESASLTNGSFSAVY